MRDRSHGLLTRRTLFLIIVGVLVTMLVCGIVFFAFFISLFNLPNQPQEAQSTVNAYINALNDYNATAAWNLISPSMQAMYGTVQNFTDSFVSQLRNTGWHAQLTENNYEYGTIAEYCLVPFQNSCRVDALIAVTQNNSQLTAETFTFDLKTYAFSNYQPSDWKINSKFTGP